MNQLKILGLAVVAASALMAFVGAGSAAATTLEVAGVAQNKPVTIEWTLKEGTSTIFRDEFSTTSDTCLSSSIRGTTASPYTGGVVKVVAASTSFFGCTHTTAMISGGSLSYSWISGTTHATVSSSGAEWTMQSTFFGATATCKTGTGTAIGTLTGAKSGNATVDINAYINCGILGNVIWTGTYTVTSPSGLGVTS